MAFMSTVCNSLPPSSLPRQGESLEVLSNDISARAEFICRPVSGYPTYLRQDFDVRAHDIATVSFSFDPIGDHCLQMTPPGLEPMKIPLPASRSVSVETNERNTIAQRKQTTPFECVLADDSFFLNDGVNLLQHKKIDRAMSTTGTISRDNNVFVASVGSVGHPFDCKGGCKFHRTLRGCKDGAMCSRCHLCRWHRSMKNKANET
eukprot:TRINITY_DN9660_c0_g1_i3.p1 TRINITY_DN9660_c0_g1~~TRINITY_DN9660_c0_g1_i3.p1  ORF type:complete len:224 (+),score=4.53 TRINITY_DN9660_c0_g1_i3:58-672(+)